MIKDRFPQQEPGPEQNELISMREILQIHEALVLIAYQFKNVIDLNYSRKHNLALKLTDKSDASTVTPGDLLANKIMINHLLDQGVILPSHMVLTEEMWALRKERSQNSESGKTNRHKKDILRTEEFVGEARRVTFAERWSAFKNDISSIYQGQKLYDLINVGVALGETIPKEGVCWVLDPIDGTSAWKNYLEHSLDENKLIDHAWGSKKFCTVIAKVVNGKPVYSAVFNPQTGELFEATPNNFKAIKMTEGSWDIPMPLPENSFYLDPNQDNRFDKPGSDNAVTAKTPEQQIGRLGMIQPLYDTGGAGAGIHFARIAANQTMFYAANFLPDQP